jgi:hypothetical protein
MLQMTHALILIAGWIGQAPAALLASLRTTSDIPPPARGLT